MKRYNLELNDIGVLNLYPNPNGEFVRYEDIPRWVSVEDELPEKPGDYIVAYEHLGVPGIREVRWYGNQWDTVLATITHWLKNLEMPE